MGMNKTTKLPIFDCHFHIINKGYPLEANDGYLPDEFSINDYYERLHGYTLKGGAVVSGSFQGFDQTYLLAALKSLGSGFVGVTQLPATVSDEEILNLNDHGVRAVRFNLNRGGSAGVEDLVSMSTRIYDLVGWHVELYLGAESLSHLEDKITALPKVCIDHLGISDSNLEILLNLIRDGLAIKATGFGRVDLNVEETIRKIHKVSPDALMFGTDLPSTRSRRVYSDKDYYTVLDILGENEAQKVFSQNAINFYGLETPQTSKYHLEGNLA